MEGLTGIYFVITMLVLGIINNKLDKIIELLKNKKV